MAVYAKQQDQIVLLLSTAEAQALDVMVAFASEEQDRAGMNGSTLSARDRIERLVQAATSNTSRSGARIE